MGGAAAVAWDLRIRSRHRLSGRWWRPGLGGHVMFIPSWLFGLLFSLGSLAVG